MSASVASKNQFDLLGNDIEDPEPPKPPTREVVKSTTFSRKRDEKVPFSVSSEPAGFQRGSYGGRGGRGRGSGGSEGAFRDRDVGRDSNRSKDTGEAGAPVRGRGGRGGRGGRRDYDRHSQTGRTDSEKQLGQGWGSAKGESEWTEERVGEELAQNDAAGAGDVQDPNAGPPAPEVESEQVEEEPEEKTKTYDEYLAELAARQANLGPASEVRAPNEGTRNDKKWASAKEYTRNEEEEGDYFPGESNEKSRNRVRKTKNLLDIELKYAEPKENRRGGGGRGGDRGGRGRGDRGDRGGRGDRGDRSDRPRGDYQPRGEYRGNKSSTAAVNIMDEKAFPTLGA